MKNNQLVIFSNENLFKIFGTLITGLASASLYILIDINTNVVNLKIDQAKKTEQISTSISRIDQTENRITKLEDRVAILPKDIIEELNKLKQ